MKWNENKPSDQSLRMCAQQNIFQCGSATLHYSSCGMSCRMSHRKFSSFSQLRFQFIISTLYCCASQSVKSSRRGNNEYGFCAYREKILKTKQKDIFTSNLFCLLRKKSEKIEKNLFLLRHNKGKRRKLIKSFPLYLFQSCFCLSSAVVRRGKFRRKKVLASEKQKQEKRAKKG